MKQREPLMEFEITPDRYQPSSRQTLRLATLGRCLYWVLIVSHFKLITQLLKQLFYVYLLWTI